METCNPEKHYKTEKEENTGSRLGVLFLGGAKRVSMAAKFRQAAAARGLALDLYSYEIDTQVPIACEAQVIIGRCWKDTDVVEHIVKVCQEHDIRLVVPFVDGAVSVAADVAQATEGRIFAPTGTAKVAEVMFNKLKANQLFVSQSLPIPLQISCEDEYRFPLIAKPCHGSASKGLVFIRSMHAWDSFRKERTCNDFLIQKCVDNRTEYTVDCYVSLLDGKAKAIVPRVRNAVIGGEVSRTTVLHITDVEDLALNTLCKLGLRGAVTIQMLRDNDTGRLMLMEINPRLGGGAVAAVAAGVDLPGMIIDECMGQPVGKCERFRDVLVCRYLSEVAFPLDKL